MPTSEGVLAPCCAGHGRERMRVPDVVPIDPDAPEALARESSRRARGLLAGVIDTHTHLLPDALYRALWRWFDVNAWRIAFRGNAEQALAELARAGVTRNVALVYAHKAGVAGSLNAYLAELCSAHPGVIGVGTVMPGEPDAARVVREAIDVHGLRGIKLHCHVQKLAIDDPRVMAVLSQCAEMRVPAVVHCGREPSTLAYGVDAHAICAVDRARRVLEALPGLRLVVPHVGWDEIDGYLALLAEFPGLYLDTSMACAEYFEESTRWADYERHADRMMYGTDFPIIPFEADRELRLIARRVVSDEAFEALVRGTARKFWEV
ncbi:MAG: amidohydrolase family protein [Deltaproteobacteria bacterium]